ncbi:MAG: ABC transporter permease, partial [Bacteroidota bacterium]
MLKHDLLIAVRNFRKHIGYSLINLIGLSIGIICGLLILLYVRHELSYDTYHDRAERIYRVRVDAKLNDTEFTGASIGYPTAEALKQDYPEVLETVRFRSRGNYLVSYGENHFNEESVIFVDSTLFDVFTIPLVAGDPQTALAAPNTMVITTELAKKYFGDQDPIGKTLTLDKDRDYQVTGIINPMPLNSHFRFDIFLSMATIADQEFVAWTNFNFQTYLLLAETADYKVLEAKFPDMIEKYIGPEVEQYLGASLEDMYAQGNRIGFFLQPLLDIHLRSDLLDELGSNGDIRYVWIFSLIGIFILGIACINFMNLATARYANRAKEIGIKKSVGAFRGQLVRQFLTESIWLSIVATLIAWLLIPLVLGGFNSLSGKELTLREIYQPSFFVLSLLLALVVGLIAGSYPAAILSRMRPVDILKGSVSLGSKSGKLRSVLVVGQFVTTVVLLISTLVVFDQLDFIQNKKIGFDKENVLVLHDSYLLDDKIQSFKEEMLSLPEVKSASITSFLPVINSNNSSSYFSGRNPLPENTRVIHNWRIDYDYVPTMGLEIIEGRNFSKEYGTDSSAILVNETLVKQYGWENPLEERLSDFGETPEDIVSFPIIGVFKDFHFNSLRSTVNPMLLHLGSSR